MRACVCGIALLLALPAFAQQDESTCVTCHELEVDESLALPVPEWRESVHAEHLVSCDACHGGDPRLEDGDESMSEEAGFLDNPSWTEMADYCGVCHEAIAERFTAGRFGRSILEGVRVATCATCHMQDGHRILVAAPEQIVTSDRCPGCPGVADADRWIELLRGLRASHDRLFARIAAVEAKGVELTDFRRRAGAVHETLVGSVHEFDDDSFDAAAFQAAREYKGLAERVSVVHGEADARVRLGVGLIAALVLLFGALLALLRSLR
jgi:hypothetical protein